MHESLNDNRNKLTTQATAIAPENWVYGPQDVSTRRPRDNAERRATGLGWFSLGLGVAQILAPGGVSRLIGASDSVLARGTLRAIGLREIAGGLGILMQPRPNTFLWARVAGDLVDLALLTEQLATQRRGTARLGLATAAVLGVTALDTMTALDVTRARRGEDPEQAGVEVTHAITINLPREQVYAFWRNLENLPKFLSHLESVKVTNGTSTWRAKAPMGTHVEWEAKVTADEPNSLIQWSSLPGSTIPNHGTVRFQDAPGDRGTEVHVALSYEPPGGALASVVAKLFGEEPKQQIKSDLRRLKQVLETGEVMHSDASIHRGLHAARPTSGEAPHQQTYTPAAERKDNQNRSQAKTTPMKAIGRTDHAETDKPTNPSTTNQSNQSATARKDGNAS